MARPLARAEPVTRRAGLTESLDATLARYPYAPADRRAELAFIASSDEGWLVNAGKTRVLGRAHRQQLLGVVVNDHVTVPRRERDAMRALLHNCGVHGWRSQARGRENFADHVLGRIAWLQSLDPVFGRRLRAAYDAIDWS